MENIDLAVGGMTCQGCVNTITRGLSKLDGVSEATVNLATKRATVLPDGSVDPVELEEAIRQTITGFGYQVLTPSNSVAADAGDHGHEHRHGHGDGPESSTASRVDEHAAHLVSETGRADDLRRRFVLAAAFAVPLLALSMVEAWQFSGWEWVAAALATPVFVWSAWPFHRSALKTARHGVTNMDTLVSIGTTAAWVWSMTVLIGGAAGVGALSEAHVYFETGAVIVALILLGKWIEVRSTTRAGDAIRALSRIQVNTVRLEDGREIPLAELEVGMRFIARPGESVATDGRVVDGEAAVDASMVTGESVPVAVTVGDEVIGGTIATDGALVIETTKVGNDTLLAQIARMVDEAQSRRASIQRLADRVSSVFVPVVILLAIATLVTWLVVTGDADRAFTAAVAVLIISCPCALGLATPLAIMVGTGRGAQLGTLIRGGQVLEDTRRVGVIVLDKTGTVTEGRMSVSTVHTPGLKGPAREELIALAAYAEKRSEHPVGRAIAALVEIHRGIKDFRSVAGQGVSAIVEGTESAAPVEVRVGSRRMFDEIPDALTTLASTAESTGATAVFVGRVPAADQGRLVPVRVPATAEAVIEVRDTVKEGSAEAVAAFRRLGLEVVLLTGDNERSARAVAAEVGIDDVRAEVLPGDKADVVCVLQATGRRVAMVGDGINDAPALAQADLGIALGTGTDVAREASDLTIVSGDLRAAVDAIRLSRRTFATIRGNLFWAFAYNVAAIPLAALGVLNPMIASAAMGGSSLFVVGNSMRLRGFTPRR
ncbi:MAG: copper-translocating P-type ATPase [Demequinaceae bacterium]|nr:copper-translocating P-type ATPase [Demequinaceae bacterium]